jgi:hypothetical protein
MIPSFLEFHEKDADFLEGISSAPTHKPSALFLKLWHQSLDLRQQPGTRPQLITFPELFLQDLLLFLRQASSGEAQAVTWAICGRLQQLFSELFSGSSHSRHAYFL